MANLAYQPYNPDLKNHSPYLVNPDFKLIMNRIFKPLFLLASFFILFSVQASVSDARSLSLYHTHTKQSLQITYYSGGQYVPAAMTELKSFLAGWRDQKQGDMDPKLMDILWQIQQITGNHDTFEIISAFRSEETNALLHKSSTKVAKNSQHMLGKAIDVRLRGLDLAVLHHTARELRLGGVGYYPGSDFIHVDTARVRYW